MAYYGDDSDGYGSRDDRYSSSIRNSPKKMPRDNYSGRDSSNSKLDKVKKYGFRASHIASRIFAIAFDAALLGLAGVYMNALAMNGSPVQPLVIVILVGSTLTLFYLLGALAFYSMHTNGGSRYNWMAVIDLCLAGCYTGLAGYLGNIGLAIPCDKEQFATEHLNRYNMGISNNIRTVIGWSKSSYQHCQQSKDLFIFSIIVAISLIASAIICKLHHHQRFSKGKNGAKLDLDDDDGNYRR